MALGWHASCAQVGAQVGRGKHRSAQVTRTTVRELISREKGVGGGRAGGEERGHGSQLGPQGRGGALGWRHKARAASTRSRPCRPGLWQQQDSGAPRRDGLS